MKRLIFVATVGGIIMRFVGIFYHKVDEQTSSTEYVREEYDRNAVLARLKSLGGYHS